MLTFFWYKFFKAKGREVFTFDAMQSDVMALDHVCFVVVDNLHIFAKRFSKLFKLSFTRFIGVVQRLPAMASCNFFHGITYSLRLS